MARKQIKIKRIENESSRQVTFSKRRGGLLKKAHDLSVLCDAEVAVIIFSSKGKLFEFASTNMPSILERYTKHSQDLGSAKDNDSLDKRDGDVLTEYMEKLNTLQRDFIGEDFEWLSLQELVKLEQQTNESLVQVRSKKGERLIQELEDVKKKVSNVSKLMTADSSFLAKLLGINLSDGVGSYASIINSICKMQNTPEHHQADAVWAEASTSQPRVNSRELANCTVGACDEARQSTISEDLNCLPRCVQ